MIGGLISGKLADKLGRKKALLYNNALAAAGAAFLTLAKSPADVYYLIIVGRFIMGLNSGTFFTNKVDHNIIQNKCRQFLLNKNKIGTAPFLLFHYSRIYNSVANNFSQLDH